MPVIVMPSQVFSSGGFHWDTARGDRVVGELLRAGVADLLGGAAEVAERDARAAGKPFQGWQDALDAGDKALAGQ